MSIPFSVLGRQPAASLDASCPPVSKRASLYRRLVEALSGMLSDPLSDVASVHVDGAMGKCLQKILVTSLSPNWNGFEKLRSDLYFIVRKSNTYTVD